MIKIDHVAIWVKDLEVMKTFYTSYFNGKAGELYHNPTKGFYSYFLKFDSEVRMELMMMKSIPKNLNNSMDQYIGINHIALAVGSKEAVDEMTSKFANDGYDIVGAPRWTGDGYYESVILDPESNRLEITI